MTNAMMNPIVETQTCCRTTSGAGNFFIEIRLYRTKRGKLAINYSKG